MSSSGENEMNKSLISSRGVKLVKSYDSEPDLDTMWYDIVKSIESGDVEFMREDIAKAIDVGLITLDDIDINKSMSMEDVEVELAKSLVGIMASLSNYNDLENAGGKLLVKSVVEGAKEVPEAVADWLSRMWSGKPKGTGGGSKRVTQVEKSLDPAVAARMNTQPISRIGHMSHPVVGTGVRNDRISENFNKSQDMYFEGASSRRIGHLRPLVKGGRKPLPAWTTVKGDEPVFKEQMKRIKAAGERASEAGGTSGVGGETGPVKRGVQSPLVERIESEGTPDKYQAGILGRGASHDEPKYLKQRQLSEQPRPGSPEFKKLPHKLKNVIRAYHAKLRSSGNKTETATSPSP